jgi:hypothetical protein
MAITTTGWSSILGEISSSCARRLTSNLMEWFFFARTRFVVFAMADLKLARTLMKRSIWPGIEMLFSDGSTAFYLGPVRSVSEIGFVSKCYDAAGKWEKDYSLRWSEIFRIEVGSRYCRHFNHYMQAKIAEAQRPPRRSGGRRIAK